MEIIILIILTIILGETTFMFFKDSSRSLGKKTKRRVFVDTSSLIDGRILSVASTGFLGDQLVIPKSVVNELQLLADGSDSEKRSRARFGLDVINSLQKIESLDVVIFHDSPKTPEGVDNRLIKLAKKYKGLILTNDFNLNKVAIVDGIQVLNINDLAQSLRSSFLPGEKLKLELVQKGSEKGQAVGYLQDGTMVVVDDASSRIGHSIEVEIIRYLQTSAGKMMFAKQVSSKQVERQQSVNRKKPTNNQTHRSTNRQHQNQNSYKSNNNKSNSRQSARKS